MDNEKNVFERFKKEPAYISEICNKLGLNNDENNYTVLKPIIKNGIQLEHTDNWNKYKEGTGEKKPNPKCDIIINNTPVSVKSGDGRATSADAFETCAIFNSVLNEYDNNDILSDNVYNIIENMKKIKK